MLGDFNDWFWVKSVRGVLARICPVRTRLRTFPARLPMMRLDRIYASRDLTIRSAWTDHKARAYSDHLPVIADVAFPGSSFWSGGLERSNSERRSNPGEGSLREPISQSCSRMQPLTPTLSP